MPKPGINAETVCAVVLAGGQGSRMGGLDKGLQCFQGEPLASLALKRLRLQSGGTPALLAINANRNLAQYQTFGVPLWADTVPDFAGPLAGMLAALRHCPAHCGHVLTVPCDSPLFPLDLQERLAAALSAHQSDVAMAVAPDPDDGGTLRPQPVFCLMRSGLADHLQDFLDHGGRKIGAWISSLHHVKVPFNASGDDPHAFANVNTLDELHQLEKR